MLRRRWAVTALLVAGAAAGAGCGSDEAVDSGGAAAAPASQQDLEAHEWLLDPEDSSVEGGDAGPVTLSFGDGEVAGVAPCNAYRGTLTVGDDGSIGISDVAATLQACEEAVMAAEDEYLAALGSVDEASLSGDDDDRLALTGEGDVRLAFRAIDAEELLTGTWEILSVNTGDSIDSVIIGTEPTVTFDPDGTLLLVTGCNDASSSWTLDGDELEVEPMRLTCQACAEPAGVMDQEAALVAALESAATVQVAPGELVLLDDDGLIALQARRD